MCSIFCNVFPRTHFPTLTNHQQMATKIGKSEETNLKIIRSISLKLIHANCMKSGLLLYYFAVYTYVRSKEEQWLIEFVWKS